MSKSLEEFYTDEIHKQLGYYAAWEPGSVLRTGDYGEIKDNRFIRIANIDSLGLDYPGHTRNSNAINYKSEGSVSINVNAKASGSKDSAEGSAEITVKFSKENSILIQAKKVSEKYIGDIENLGNALMSRKREGKWESKYAVITELRIAEAGTILVSKTSDASITLKAKGSVKNGANLGDASLDLQEVSSKNIGYKVISRKGITPLIKLMKLKNPIFDDAHLELV